MIRVCGCVYIIYFVSMFDKGIFDIVRNFEGKLCYSLLVGYIEFTTLLCRGK